jgi:hypothetical protein
MVIFVSSGTEEILICWFDPEKIVAQPETISEIINNKTILFNLHSYFVEFRIQWQILSLFLSSLMLFRSTYEINNPGSIQAFLDATSAMDGARVLQLCRARESGSVERCDNPQRPWRPLSG